MNSITGRITQIILEGVKYEFSPQIQEKWQDIIDRPSGEIDILVGSEVAGLHPRIAEVQGNLVVMTSQFGTGWTIYGNHPTFPDQKITFSAETRAIRAGGIKIAENRTVQSSARITITAPIT